jgi:branched-chain amino acid transport system substrate-binding protein
MRRIAAALAAASAATLVITVPPAGPKPSAKGPECGKTRTIGLLAPLSGDVAFLGREQRNWVKLAILRYNARHPRKFTLEDEDTRLDPDRAAARAQQLAANAKVLGVVGPAGSEEVPAVAPVFKRAGVAYVSGSADRDSLTNGDNVGFFRVVPNEDRQAPTDASYIVSVLRADHVLIVDDESAYSVPLANAVQKLLRARNVNVKRDSVGPSQTSFASTINKVTRDIDLVFLPWQDPARAQDFGEQMRDRGKKATLFGSDGLFSSDFKLNGSYVSLWAPDIRQIRVAAAVVRDYNRRFGTTWTPLGTPAYVATQVVMAAIERACRNGSAARTEVRSRVAATKLRATVLGVPISFAKGGDLRRARFYVYKVVNHKFVLVA